MRYHTKNSFWSKVRIASTDVCWEWLGYCNGPRSYGRLDFGGHKGVYAHRVAYWLAHGKRIPLRRGTQGKMVLHRCDNPKCCNPNHLYLGDHAQNMRDLQERNRGHQWCSIDSPRAKLTAEDVFWMRLQKRYGATKKALAMLYEVSEATVSGACYGRHYQDVP